MGVEVGGGRGRKEGRERRVGCQEVERTGENEFEDFKAAFCGLHSRFPDAQQENFSVMMYIALQGCGFLKINSY